MPDPALRSFVGRDEELAGLLDSLEAVDRDPVFVLVTGARGAGKSTLVRAFADRAGAAGVPVHWGSGREVGGAPALWPWIQVLRSIGDAALSDLPLELAAHRDEPFAAYDAATTALRHHLDGRSVVVVDDLHAADAASLGLVRFLAHAGHGLPLLFVGVLTTGAGGPNDDVDGLVAELAAVGRRLEVGPLGVEAVEELLGHLPEDLVDLAPTLHERSGGNSFYVTQLVEAVARSGRAGAGLLPDGVAATVRSRLAELPAATQRLVGAAAVVGSPPIRVEVLAAVAGATVARVRADLRPAVLAGLLVDSPAGPGFTHDLVRQAVDLELDPSRRADHHLAAARAWASASIVAEPSGARVAQHLIDADRAVPPEDVAFWADRAAREATDVAAHPDAARWHQVAAEHWARSGDAERQAENLAGAIDSLAQAGAGSRAIALGAELHLLGKRVGSGRILARAALARADLFEPGQAVEAPPLLEEALAHPDLAAEPSTRIELLRALAVLLGMPTMDGWRRDTPGARRALSQLEDLAGDDEAGRAQVGLARLHVDSGPAHHHDRRRWLAQADQHRPAGANVADRLDRLYWATSLAFEAGDLPEVERHLRDWARLADLAGSTYWSWRVDAARAGLALARADFAEATRIVARATPAVADLHPEMAFHLAAGLELAVAALQGRLDAFDGVELAALGVFAPLVAAFRGDREQAVRLIDRSIAEASTTSADDIHWLLLVSTAAIAAVEIGDPERSRWAAAALEPHQDQLVMFGRSYLPGHHVAELVGQARATAGDRHGAAEAFRRTLTWADRVGARAHGARARVGLAAASDPSDPNRQALAATARAAAADLGLQLVVEAADRVLQASPAIPVAPPALGASPSALPSITVCAFGRLEVWAPGAATASRWSSRKARDALKLLLCARGRPLHREQLIDALWPDVDLAIARRRLSVVLSMLRAGLDPERLLASDPLRADRDALALDLSLVDVDVERYLEAGAVALTAHGGGEAEADDLLATARRLDRGGEVLAEDPYFDAAGPLRLAVAKLRRDLLIAIADRAAARGDRSAAIDALHGLVAAEAADEGPAAQLIDLLVREGRSREAAAVADARAARRRELGLPDGR